MGRDTHTQGKQSHNSPSALRFAHLDLLAQRRQLCHGVERGAGLSLGLRRPLASAPCRRRGPALPVRVERGFHHGCPAPAPSNWCDRRAAVGKVHMALRLRLRLCWPLVLQLRATAGTRHAARVSPRLVTASGGCAQVLARPEQVHRAGGGAHQGCTHHRPPTPHVRLLAWRRHHQMRCGALQSARRSSNRCATLASATCSPAPGALRAPSPSSCLPALAGGMAPPGRPSSRLDRVAERADLALAKRLHEELNHERPRRRHSDVTVSGQARRGASRASCRQMSRGVDV